MRLNSARLRPATRGRSFVWFLLGIAVGLALAVALAKWHDDSRQGGSSPFVNWTNLSDGFEVGYEQAAAQFNRLYKWATGQY